MEILCPLCAAPTPKLRYLDRNRYSHNNPTIAFTIGGIDHNVHQLPTNPLFVLMNSQSKHVTNHKHVQILRAHRR
jgi:hypothetical protein